MKYAEREARAMEVLREAKRLDDRAVALLPMSRAQIIALAPARFRKKGAPRHTALVLGVREAAHREPAGTLQRRLDELTQQADRHYWQTVQLAAPIVKKWAELAPEADDAAASFLRLYALRAAWAMDLGRERTTWRKTLQWWMRSGLQRLNQASSRGVMGFTVYKRRAAFLTEHGPDFAWANIVSTAGKLRVSPEQLSLELSLERPLSMSGGVPVLMTNGVITTKMLGATLEAPSQLHAVEALFDTAVLLDRLPIQKGYIVARHFGLWGDEGDCQSFTAIGHELGMRRSSAHYHCHEALKALRSLYEDAVPTSAWLMTMRTLRALVRRVEGWSWEEAAEEAEWSSSETQARCYKAARDIGLKVDLFERPARWSA